MNAIDLRPTIIARSDQLNADDLIGTSRTITITAVRLRDAADQPIAIHYEGDDGKPYLPCKSMRRVMVAVWGDDGNAFVGQRLTLFRDDRVTFGKDAVGGIRISHMSGIDRERTLALMVTRGQRKPYTVKPLPPEKESRRAAPQGAGQRAAAGQPPPSLEQRAAAFMTRVAGAATLEKLKAIETAAAGLRADLERADPELLAECDLALDARLTALEGLALDRPDQDEADGLSAGQGEAAEVPPDAPPPPQETKPDDGKPTLRSRVEAFKGRVSEAKTTIKLKSIHAAAAELRRDVDVADPELLAEMDEHFNARFAALEDEQKGAR